MCGFTPAIISLANSSSVIHPDRFTVPNKKHFKRCISLPCLFMNINIARIRNMLLMYYLELL